MNINVSFFPTPVTLVPQSVSAVLPSGDLHRRALPRAPRRPTDGALPEPDGVGGGGAYGVRQRGVPHEPGRADGDGRALRQEPTGGGRLSVGPCHGTLSEGRTSGPFYKHTSIDATANTVFLRRGRAFSTKTTKTVDKQASGSHTNTLGQ